MFKLIHPLDRSPNRPPRLHSSKSSNGTLMRDVRIGFIGFYHRRWLVDPIIDGTQEDS
jgi:hypothetical protein